jgi:hypothetical protein
MAEVTNVSSLIVGFYQSFLESLPAWLQVFVNLFLLVLVVVLYAIFVWKFYRFISKKNILELNLNQYNKFEKTAVIKLMAGIFYFLEYIVILPFLIFFWFSFFTIFLILLTDGLSIETILIISAVIIGAVRMTSYYKEDVSKEVAKLFPYTLLAVSMTKANFFNFERILENITQIPSFYHNIVYYLAFIIILEIVLRAFDMIISLFHLEVVQVNEAELDEAELKPPKNG